MLDQPSFIGWWMARNQRQKAHLVQSEITDRLVMRCGRQMRLETSGGLLVEAEFERCEQCVGRIVAD
jgi:hypothetical protein